MFLDSDSQGLNGSSTGCASPSSPEIAEPYGEEKASGRGTQTSACNCGENIGGSLLEDDGRSLRFETGPQDRVAGYVDRSMCRGIMKKIDGVYP